MIAITLPQPPWQALPPLSPLGIAAVTLVIGYIILEVIFFFHCKWQLVPRANRISLGPPAPYRDYPSLQDRTELLRRIIVRLLERIPFDEHQTDIEKFHVESCDAACDVFYKFALPWFDKKEEDVHYPKFSEQFDIGPLDDELCPPPPALKRMANSIGYTSTTDDSSSDEETLDRESSTILQKAECNGNTCNGPTENEVARINMGGIKKGNGDELLSWLLFGVPVSTVQSSPSMQKALDDLYIKVESEWGFTLEPGKNTTYKMRSFTFEKVNCIHRLLFVYASVALLRMVANCFLYIMGFRQYSCKRGLRYWHRPAKQQQGPPGSNPFLFFHGMAPGGYAPYLPMIFWGILKDHHQYRDVFLFENNPIAHALSFDALSEEDTIQGVMEAIQKHLGSSHVANNLTLCGHSFGSCQLVWMLKAPEIKNKISSLVLIDPVSILLSEPDVLINFLYAGQDCQDAGDRNSSESLLGRLIRFFNENKLRFAAGGELSIEYYLRRHFAWYNSELWLQDIHQDINVVVCLAGLDELVNTSKIEGDLAAHNSMVGEVTRFAPSACGHIETIIWRDVGHGHCVGNPSSWSDIHNAMRSAERII